MDDRGTRNEGRGTGEASPPLDLDPPSLVPLLRRYPALASIPRVALGSYPTPVERVPAAEELWVKRDDLTAPEMGGNKVRALEFLLGGLRPGGEVITLGGTGSTHVLCTAHHAARIGLRTRAVRWAHEMNPAAEAVAARAGPLCAGLEERGGAVRGMAAAQLARLRDRQARFIPIGGSTPLGVLGHVNAGLELAEQVAAGALPEPARVVIPLGSGGTSAGLALGFRIAGLRSIVVGARVAPRIGSNGWRVLRIARTTAALIGSVTGERVPVPEPWRVRVVHDAYGGAYGRATAESDEAAATLWRLMGIRLDGTYGAKAFAVALRLACRGDGPTLFWLTFDGRWMT